MTFKLSIGSRILLPIDFQYHKMSRKFRVLLVGFLFLFSCSFRIRFNNTGYRYISVNDQRLFQPFDISSINQVVDCSEICSVQKIDSAAISQIVEQYEFVWIKFVAPWCRGSNCQNIHQYFDVQNKYDGKLKLVLVFTSYDANEIRELLSISNITNYTYILDGEKFSSNITTYQKEFYNIIQSITNGGHPSIKQYATSYLLHKDHIVYFSDHTESYDDLIREFDKLIQ